MLAAEMPEFTVTIETPDDTTRDEAILDRVTEAIRANPEARAPLLRLDRGRGVITAKFQVEARGLEQAQYIAIQAFTAALRAAGLSGDKLWRIVEAGD
jgi:hypothetical protein